MSRARPSGVAPGWTVVASAAAGLSWWSGRLWRLQRSVKVYASYWIARSQEPGWVGGKEPGWVDGAEPGWVGGAIPRALCLVALGDSVAQGIGASSPERGYVGVLASRIESVTGRGVRVVNLSRSGARIREVAALQLSRMLALPHADIVTLAVGGNDVRDRSRTWEADVLELLDQLPAGTIVADVPDFGGGPGRRQSERAARTMRLGVEARDLRLAGLEAATREHMNWRCYAADGFHPNNHGHRVWADALWPAITDALEFHPSANERDARPG